MSFDQYQQQCRQAIIERPDFRQADSDLQQKILHANLPREWPADRQQAVILVHGLYDSPCIMQSLAQFFHRQSYVVRNLLLPGHGTVPEALLACQGEQWLATVRFAINTLPESITQIVLVGFSTGGLLAQILSQNAPDPRIKAILALAPALALHPLPGYLLKKAWLIDALARFFPWSHQGTVYDYAKYTRHALNGALQVQRLIDRYEAKQTVDIPVFYVLSQEDSVIHSPTVWQYFSHHCQHPASRCLIYSAKPLALKDPRITVKSSQYAQDSIVNFSHVALPVAPDHFHYGAAGDYTEAVMAQKPPDKPLIQGEWGGKTTVRLTYNPDFAGMILAMEQFLTQALQ